MKYEWQDVAPGVEIARPHPTVTVVLLRHPPASDGTEAMLQWATRTLAAAIDTRTEHSDTHDTPPDQPR